MKTMIFIFPLLLIIFYPYCTDATAISAGKGKEWVDRCNAAQKYIDLERKNRISALSREEIISAMGCLYYFTAYDFGYMHGILEPYLIKNKGNPPNTTLDNISHQLCPNDPYDETISKFLAYMKQHTDENEQDFIGIINRFYMQEYPCSKNSKKKANK